MTSMMAMAVDEVVTRTVDMADNLNIMGLALRIDMGHIMTDTEEEMAMMVEWMVLQAILHVGTSNPCTQVAVAVGEVATFHNRDQ